MCWNHEQIWCMKMSKFEEKGEITHRKIEQILGKALINEIFLEKLLTDPVKVGRELGLNESGIEILKTSDLKILTKFREKLSAKLLKDAATIIFCAV